MCLHLFEHLIYKSRSPNAFNTLFILIEFKREYVYERLWNCTVIKEDHNAEKHVQYMLTTFGFENQISDGDGACVKQG